MKIIGYFILGLPYCLSCIDSLDLDLDEEEMEPIFSGDVYPYALHCNNCGEVILLKEGESPEEIELEETEGEETVEEKELTCNLCSLRDFCPQSGDPRNIDGKCLPGFFYDLEEEGGEEGE